MAAKHGGFSKNVKVFGSLRLCRYIEPVYEGQYFTGSLFFILGEESDLEKNKNCIFID